MFSARSLRGGRLATQDLIRIFLPTLLSPRVIGCAANLMACREWFDFVAEQMFSLCSFKNARTTPISRFRYFGNTFFCFGMC